MKSERMKKWTAGAVALLFGISIIGFTIKLSYDVMVILFPTDPILKYISIALYDGGVIAWLTTYIGRAKGTPQRGIALLMTILDFLGVTAMVIAGIYLSGQTLANIPPWVGSSVVNITIIAAVINAGAIYYYHANDPATREEIQAQELEDDLNEEALDQARYLVQQKARDLGNILANRVTARMKYRMRLPMTDRENAEWNNEIVDAQAYDPATLPPPPVQDETFWSAVKSFFGGKQSRQSSDTMQSKSSMDSQDLQKFAQTSDAWAAWEDQEDGTRRPLWCKVCRDEGKDWLSPEPCEHILMAEPETLISTETAVNTLRKLMNEPMPKAANAE